MSLVAAAMRSRRTTECRRSAARRRGMTAIELVIVLAIVGALVALVFPRSSRVFAGSAMRAAKMEIKATLVRARAAAIQNGRPAQFIRRGDVIHVTQASGGQQVRVGPENDLRAGHRVELSSASDTIRFDPRGFAPGIGPNPPYLVIYLSRGTLRDSVCVSRLGRISSTGACQ